MDAPDPGGETRTLDETFIDLREQATARFGLQAFSLGVPHAFLAGAFLAGKPWAVEIRNLRPPTAFSAASIQPHFDTAAFKVDKPMLLVAGAGRDAVIMEDRELLQQIIGRRPRQPEQFMRLLGDVNRRAADSGHVAARTISRSCTTVYMPPSGEGVKPEWYGPKEERHLAPAGISHLFQGIDLGEMARPMMESFQALQGGTIDEKELDRRLKEAGENSVRPEGRRHLRQR